MLGATPATTSPAANRATPATNGRTSPRLSHSRPPSTVPSSVVSCMALNAQPYRESPPRSRRVTGRAVATAIASNAKLTTVRSRPAVRSRWPAPQIPAAPGDAAEAPGRDEGARRVTPRPSKLVGTSPVGTSFAGASGHAEVPCWLAGVGEQALPEPDEHAAGSVPDRRKQRFDGGDATWGRQPPELLRAV